MFTLSPLPYAYDALEPYIDTQTMELHHDKHHQTYVNKLNAALAGHDQLAQKGLKDLLSNLNEVPEDIRTAVRNHGGGHFNHTLFWKLLKKNGGTVANGGLATAIEKKFGSFEEFKQKFINKASTLFGSGWTWLVLNNNQLEITTSQNQDCPLSDNKIPLLTVDVWEHAYYLKYQNKRPEYLEAFFEIINWEKVNEYYSTNLG